MERSIEEITINDIDADLDLPEDGIVRDPSIIKKLVVRQEVARALMSGLSVEEVANYLHVEPKEIEKAMRKTPMADMLHIESMRIARHLTTRDLSKEKYLALTTALGVQIEKARLLREQPTSIQEERSSLDRLEEILFRGSIPVESRRVEDSTPAEPQRESTPLLPEPVEPPGKD